MVMHEGCKSGESRTTQCGASRACSNIPGASRTSRRSLGRLQSVPFQSRDHPGRARSRVQLHGRHRVAAVHAGRRHVLSAVVRARSAGREHCPYRSHRSSCMVVRVLCRWRATGSVAEVSRVAQGAAAVERQDVGGATASFTTVPAPETRSDVPLAIRALVGVLEVRRRIGERA